MWYTQNRKKVISLAMMLVLVTLGGTSLAAQRSLPGDILYPIKINVNEKAQSLLSIGLRSNTETETAHAVARLSEVENLAAKGRLDPQVKAEAETRFKDSASKVSQDVKQLQVEGDTKTATEVTSGLEDSLQNHKIILSALSKVGGEQAQLLSDLASTVDTHLKVATIARTDAEAKIATSSNAIDIKASANKSLESAQDTVKKVDTAIGIATSDELKTQASSQLVFTNKLIMEGKIKVKAKAFGDAYILFEKARRIAEGARLMLESENQIKPNIRAFIQIKREDNNDEATATSGATTTIKTEVQNNATSTDIKLNEDGTLEATSTPNQIQKDISGDGASTSNIKSVTGENLIKTQDKIFIPKKSE